MRWPPGQGQRVEAVFCHTRQTTENGYIESFNGKFRDECLNRHWFLDLADFWVTIED